MNISELEFVQTALGNAFPDKLQFFGADYEQDNNCWPKAMDIRFKDFAISRVAPLIKKKLSSSQSAS